MKTYRQSGVVPIRRGKKTEVLLIRNRADDSWIFPKGLLENYLTPRESAQKEAYEEAGVRGRATAPIGEYGYRKWGGEYRVEMFLLEDVEEFSQWPEDFRKRKWVKLNKSLLQRVDKNLSPIVKSLLKYENNGGK